MDLHTTSNIHQAHPFFWTLPSEKPVAWDLDILGGEGLPRSQEIIRSHQDSNLSMSPYQVMFGLALAIHQPVVGLTKRIAVWCTWPWLLLQSPWDLRFAHGNFKQLVVVSLGSTLSTTPNARLATHIKTMRSITNTTIHSTCCYSHTQRSPFSPRRPHIPRFLRAWLKHISLCLMEPQHILQLHVPAMSTLQEVLLYFSGLLPYLHVSNSGKCGEDWKQTTCPAKGGLATCIFFRYPRAFYDPRLPPFNQSIPKNK